MGYQKASMTNYSADKTTVVRYVENQLTNSEHDLPWTMTITPGKSGAYCVTIAIDESSDDTEQERVASFFSLTQVNI
jgi:hypothetical protein